MTMSPPTYLLHLLMMARMILLLLSMMSDIQSFPDERGKSEKPTIRLLLRQWITTNISTMSFRDVLDGKDDEYVPSKFSNNNSKSGRTYPRKKSHCIRTVWPGIEPGTLK